MIRGTFGNARLQNELVPEREGEFTRLSPDGRVIPVFEAAKQLREDGVPMVVVAGKNYGMGSSRDWAAKGTSLLGIRAIIAENFERIHRANLVCMGILPLEFKAGDSRLTLGLSGAETFDIVGLERNLSPGDTVLCRIHSDGVETREIELRLRIETEAEMTYFRHGSILNHVLRNLTGDEHAAN